MRKITTLFILLSVSSPFALIYSQISNVSPFDTTMYGRNDKAGHYLKIRGFDMYYEIYGKGQPLLMIHGNGGCISHYFYQLPYFSKDYQVIIADSRAQGKSVDTNDSLSFEMMADDFNALLDSLHLDSCFIIGVSDGGINGLLLAIRHPVKVKKLAITGANLWPDTTAIQPFLYNWAMKYNCELKNKQQTLEVKNERKLARLLSFEPHISTKQLNTIQCPTLVIGGDHDVIRPQHTLLIAESIAKSYLWILPNSGHPTLINNKDQFNDIVNTFFQKPYRKIEGFDHLK